MLAGRLTIASREFAVVETETPSAGRGEVRIRVAAAGVCLSDVHLIDGTLKPLFLRTDSVTLGHEVAGTIDEIGDSVRGFDIGQRVLLQAGELRGQQVHTRGVDYDGGWAEYAIARADTVVPIPDELSFEEACFIPDAVSTPWAAITVTAGVKAAQPVGVWGVGGLGAHAVQLLRMIGAAPIVAVDPLPGARERALAFGADAALDPTDPEFRSKMGIATGGQGLAVALDFAGVAAVRDQAVKSLGAGGKLVLVGLTNQPLTITDGTRFSYLQQQVLGHYGSDPSHVQQLVDLTRLGRIEFSRSVSRVMPLAEAAKAVAMLESKTGDPIRIVLTP